MERAYTIPLRVVYNRAARKERAKRAMKHIREFVAKHMKVSPENVKIHPSVNMLVWQRGIEKPPRKVRVVAVKEGETVWVYTQEERARMEKEQPKREEKKEEETVKLSVKGEAEEESKEKSGGE